MRRIVSKTNHEKKQKKKGIILAVVLVVILFGSTFGIIVNSFGKSRNLDSDAQVKYNGYNFVYYNGFWTIENTGNLFFSYNPKETEELDIKKFEITGSLENYKDVPVYIYSEDQSSELEIYRNIFQFASRMQNACPSDRKCMEDIPVKDCSNNFIIIEISQENEIYQEDNCVYIKGQKENLIKLSDEFLFKLLGIK